MKYTAVVAVSVFLFSGCVQVNDQTITTGDLLNSAVTIFNSVEKVTNEAITTATETKDSAVNMYNDVTYTLETFEQKADLVKKLME